MFDSISLNYIIIVLVTLIISVSIHEAMHGLVARYLGDTTAHDAGRISLNPLRHVDIWFTILIPTVLLLLHLPPIFAAKPVPFDPNSVRFGEFGAALVGIAGPVSNLLLAVITGIFMRIGGIDIFSGLGSVLIIFMSINVSLFVFNMIPFPPLDGSRLLYALAPDPLRRVMEQIEAAGFAVTIMVLLLLSSFISPIITNISQAIITFLLR
jgi:Zn-dependent protease